MVSGRMGNGLWRIGRLPWQIQSLQFIDTKGTKRFLPGGKTNGCFFPYGTEQDEKVYITEGLATAATIFSLTGIKTLATFSAGNLKQVSIDIRKNYPNIKIVICADDDWMTAGNPGISKAVEAARGFGPNCYSGISIK